MPFALVLFGAILLVAGVRKQQSELFSLLKSDFTGQGNFVYWVLAIMVIGAIGYIPRLRPLSHGFLVLALVVIFLSQKGFFADLTAAINTTKTAGSPASPIANTQPGPGSISPASVSDFGAGIPQGPIPLTV